MTLETTTMLKYEVMGLIIGVMLTLIVGVKGEFLVSKGTIEKMANAAVVTAKAEICVAQFTKAPHYQERLKQFKTLNFIQRDNFIENGGWDRMPGEEESNPEVNRACGDRIATLAMK